MYEGKSLNNRNFILKCVEKYVQRKILFRDTKWLLSNMSYVGSWRSRSLSLRSRPYNMAAPLSTCTVEEQRSVIRFLWSEGVKQYEIYRRMKVQYRDSCLSQGRVYEWVKRFQNGRQDVSDEHRNGRPVSVASETVEQQVELFCRGHPQACGQVDQVCCEAGGLCRKIRHKPFL